MENNLNEALNSSLSNFRFGDYATVGDWYQGWYYPRYYPVVCSTLFSEDKGMKALRLAKKLMDFKIVNLKTVKDFVDLLDLLIQEI